MKIMDIMKNSKGFTLIELIIVMIIIGILAAIVTPKFISLEDDAQAAARAGITGSVRSAWAIAVGEHQNFPTVAQLAEFTQGGTAVPTGIEVVAGSSTYIVPTYTGTGCVASGDTCTGTGCAATSGDPATSTQEVTCVGAIPTT